MLLLGSSQFCADRGDVALRRRNPCELRHRCRERPEGRGDRVRDAASRRGLSRPYICVALDGLISRRPAAVGVLLAVIRSAAWVSRKGKRRRSALGLMCLHSRFSCRVSLWFCRHPYLQPSTHPRARLVSAGNTLEPPSFFLTPLLFPPRFSGGSRNCLLVAITKSRGDGRRERTPPPRAAAHYRHGGDRPVHRGVHVEVRQRCVDRGPIHGVQRVDFPLPGHAGAAGGPGSTRGKPRRSVLCPAVGLEGGKQIRAYLWRVFCVRAITRVVLSVHWGCPACKTRFSCVGTTGQRAETVGLSFFFFFVRGDTTTCARSGAFGW